MFVSGWKWYSEIKDDLYFPLLSCESLVSVKENPDGKNNRIKQKKPTSFSLSLDQMTMQITILAMP